MFGYQGSRPLGKHTTSQSILINCHSLLSAFVWQHFHSVVQEENKYLQLNGILKHSESFHLPLKLCKMVVHQEVLSDFNLSLLLVTYEETVIIHAEFCVPFSGVQDVLQIAFLHLS